MPLRFRRALLWILLTVVVACGGAPQVEPADLLILNGRVYSFSWSDPAPDGTPAPNAPHAPAGWQADGEAIAIRGDTIVVGEADPGRLLAGTIRMTIVGGKVVFGGS